MQSLMVTGLQASTAQLFKAAAASACQGEGLGQYYSFWMEFLHFLRVRETQVQTKHKVNLNGMVPNPTVTSMGEVPAGQGPGQPDLQEALLGATHALTTSSTMVTDLQGQAGKDTAAPTGQNRAVCDPSSLTFWRARPHFCGGVTTPPSSSQAFLCIPVSPAAGKDPDTFLSSHADRALLPEFAFFLGNFRRSVRSLPWCFSLKSPARR